MRFIFFFLSLICFSSWAGAQVRPQELKALDAKSFSLSLQQNSAPMVLLNGSLTESGDGQVFSDELTINVRLIEKNFALVSIRAMENEPQEIYFMKAEPATQSYLPINASPILTDSGLDRAVEVLRASKELYGSNEEGLNQILKSFEENPHLTLESYFEQLTRFALQNVGNKAQRNKLQKAQSFEDLMGANSLTDENGQVLMNRKQPLIQAPFTAEGLPAMSRPKKKKIAKTNLPRLKPSEKGYFPPRPIGGSTSAQDGPAGLY